MGIVQQAHEEAAAGNKESKAGQGCDEMDRVTVVTLGEWYREEDALDTMLKKKQWLRG